MGGWQSLDRARCPILLREDVPASVTDRRKFRSARSKLGQTARVGTLDDAWHVLNIRVR